ncbi:hypothetical protein IQ07DRAFT_585888, partial [Pyrenochaeta sp. DS3sAY3a]
MTEQLQAATKSLDITRERQRIRDEALARGIDAFEQVPILPLEREFAYSSDTPGSTRIMTPSDRWERNIIDEVKQKLHYETISDSTLQRYANSFLEFDTMLQDMKANPRKLVEAFPPPVGIPWWQNYEQWTPNYSRISPFFLDSLVPYSQVWWLDQQANAAFISQPPKLALRSFFAGQQEMFYSCRIAFQPPNKTSADGDTYDDYFGGSGKESTENMSLFEDIVLFVLTIHPVAMAISAAWEFGSGYNILGYKLTTFQQLSAPLAFLLRGPIGRLFSWVGKLGWIAIKFLGSKLGPLLVTGAEWLLLQTMRSKPFLKAVISRVAQQLWDKLTFLASSAVNSAIMGKMRAALQYVTKRALDVVDNVLLPRMQKLLSHFVPQEFATTEGILLRMEAGEKISPEEIAQMTQKMKNAFDGIGKGLPNNIKRNIASVVAKEIEARVIDEAPALLTEFLESLAKKFRLPEGFDVSALKRVMQKYVQVEQMQGQMVEEIWTIEALPQLQSRVMNAAAKLEMQSQSGAALKPVLLEGYNVLTSDGLQFTDDILGFMDTTVTADLLREGCNGGTVYAVDFVEAKLSAKGFAGLRATATRLANGQFLRDDLIPHLRGAAEWAYDNVAARLARAGEAVPTLEEYTAKFIAANSKGGQIVRDALTVLKDGKVQYQGRVYKLIAGPRGNVTDVQYTAVVPKNAITPRMEAFLIKSMRDRGFTNVNVEYLKVDEKFIEDVCEEIHKQIVTWVKDKVIPAELMNAKWLEKFIP